MESGSVRLVGVDAGATKSVAIAVDDEGRRLGRGEGPGANPKRHGLDDAADRISALVAGLTAEAGGVIDSAAPRRLPDLVFVAGAGIDRPQHARALEAALAARLRSTAGGPRVARVLVANDTLAVLRAGTPDGVGLAVPVSTGGNVIGRGPDGRVTDRGHGIFGGGYVLGALAARAARRGADGRVADGRDAGGRDAGGRDASAAPHAGRELDAPRHRVGPELAAAIDGARLEWRSAGRPGPDAALLGAAVATAAEHGDPYPVRIVDRWCAHVTRAVAEEVGRLGLGARPIVVVYGGLADASPWLAGRIRAAVLAGSPGARLTTLAVEPAEGAALLALDAWRGAPVGWDFRPRR